MVPSMGMRRGEPVSGFSLWIFKGFLWIAVDNKVEKRNQKKTKFFFQHLMELNYFFPKKMDKRLILWIGGEIIPVLLISGVEVMKPAPG